MPKKGDQAKNGGDAKAEKPAKEKGAKKLLAGLSLPKDFPLGKGGTKALAKHPLMAELAAMALEALAGEIRAKVKKLAKGSSDPAPAAKPAAPAAPLTLAKSPPVRKTRARAAAKPQAAPKAASAKSVAVEKPKPAAKPRARKAASSPAPPAKKAATRKPPAKPEAPAPEKS